MRIIKYLFCIISIVFFGTKLSAQVEGKIVLLPDNKTYQVSVIPQTTFNSNLSRTNSAQITLTAPTGSFEVTNVQGVDGQEWAISGFAKAPAENSGFDYYSVELTSQWAMMYTAGEEIILFTFENSAVCVGSISIIDDRTDPFLPPNSQNLNVGNLFTILGVGPVNAYQGSAVPTATCPDALDATATATVGTLNCPEDVTTMVIDIQGGEAPFTIIYTNTTTGEVDSVISDQLNASVTLQNITGGSYTIQISDAKNSSSILSEVVNAPDPITFNLNATAANCMESHDGAVEITDLNRDNVTFDWGTDFDNTPSLSSLDPDTYTVTVTDDNGCESTQSTIVKMDGWIMMESSVTDVSCFGMDDGVIDINTNGKNFPFTYEWDNGRQVGTGDNLTGLTPGDYSITVTDATGICQEVTTMTVNEPDALSASALIDSSSICELETESIVTVGQVTNARGALSYSVDGIEFSNSNRFVLDAGQSYTITVQDAAGCDADIDVTLPEPSGLSVDLPEDIILNLGNDLEIEADFAASSNVDFSWSPAESLSCDDCPNPMATPTRTTTYTLTVSDDNGCIKEASVIVYLSTTRRVFAPNIFSPNGDGLNDLYTIFTSTDALSVNKLNIYDRWGEKVYESPTDFVPGDEFNHGWDGRYHGQNAPNGVYVYTIEITFIDGKTEVFSGELTLAR